MKTTNRLLRVGEVARRLSVSDVTLRLWSKEGKFPAPIRVGRWERRWREQDIERFLRTGSAGVEGERGAV